MTGPSACESRTVLPFLGFEIAGSIDSQSVVI